MQAKFLLPFLFSFLSSIIAIWFLLRAEEDSKAKLSPLLKLSFRKRLGGVVVIAVFALLVLADKNLVITKPIAGILVGGGLILIFGFWDDLKNLSWKTQLIFQIIIALTAIFFGVKSGYISNPFSGTVNLENPLIYLPLFILYFLLFMNSLNWLDGIDGLSGSVTLVALATIFLLSFKPEVNQPATAILCAIAGGSVLGFLVFNFYPAKILAGTGGAWFFGFVLASLSIFAGAKIATVLMATLIPVLDLANVVWERHRAGQSIFSGGDNRHLHHKLIKLGLGERQIVILASAVSILIGAIALNIGAAGKLIFIVLFSFLYFGLIRIFRIIG